MAPSTRRTVFCPVPPTWFGETPHRSHAFCHGAAAPLRGPDSLRPSKSDGYLVERGMGGGTACVDPRRPSSWKFVSGDSLLGRERDLRNLFLSASHFIVSELQCWST